MDYTFQFRDVFTYWPLLVEGVWHTILFSLAGIIVGLTIGIAGAYALTSRSMIARKLVTTYVEFFRNTPMLVQLFIIYFALPSAGVRFPPTIAAVIALVLNNGAYTTEIVRAGIEGIHPSQTEAGLALGMSRFEVFRYIVLLPALQNVYPALVSQFILLMLGSSIISSIGAEDLTSLANLIQSQNFRSFEVYIVATLIYLALAIAFRLVFAAIARVVFASRALASRAG